MKISELIAAYGDENVEVQNLDECGDRVEMKGGVTRITFGTQQPLSLDEDHPTKRLGLVIWLDRNRVKELMETAKAESQP